MALGIAATAMPFAGSREAEAERWLRILRMHGDASLILSSLGVSEAPQEDVSPAQQPIPSTGASAHDAVALVKGEAERSAAGRGAELVETGDVLLAVLRVYNETFDRVLHAHGTSAEEVRELLELRCGADEEADGR
jgi:hypothetical protein